MKKIGVLIISLFLGISVAAATTTESVQFVRCVDGDTAVFKVSGEEVKFRFLAIDTPETVHPIIEAEAFGSNASEYTCNKLTNAKEIIVEYEESNKIDKYDRHLAWIWIDGSMLQKELVDVGYAQVAYIYGDYRYTESLCLAQSKAKEKGVGLWSENPEEGYCSTVDLADVKNNIIFEDIDQPAGEEPTEEEVKSLEETLDNIDKKIEDFINNENNSTIFVVGFLIVAAVTFLYKEFKK